MKEIEFKMLGHDVLVEVDGTDEDGEVTYSARATKDGEHVFYLQYPMTDKPIVRDAEIVDSFVIEAEDYNDAYAMAWVSCMILDAITQK